MNKGLLRMENNPPVLLGCERAAQKSKHTTHTYAKTSYTWVDKSASSCPSCGAASPSEGESWPELHPSKVGLMGSLLSQRARRTTAIPTGKS